MLPTSEKTATIWPLSEQVGLTPALLSPYAELGQKQAQAADKYGLWTLAPCKH